MENRKDSLDIVDDFFLNLPKYIEVVLKNISIVVLISSLFGAAIQIFFLISISWSTVVFYSAKQGIIEGGVFIIFFFLLSLFYFWFIRTLAWLHINKSTANQRKLIISLLGIIIIYLYTTASHKIYISMILLIPMLFNFIVIKHAFLVADNKISSKKKTYSVIEKEILESRTRRDTLIVFTVYMAWIFSIALIFTKLQKVEYDKIENFSTFKKKIERENGTEYILEYYNTDYMFFTNKNNGLISIFKTDDVIAEK